MKIITVSFNKDRCNMDWQSMLSKIHGITLVDINILAWSINKIQQTKPR